MRNIKSLEDVIKLKILFGQRNYTVYGHHEIQFKGECVGNAAGESGCRND